MIPTISASEAALLASARDGKPMLLMTYGQLDTLATMANSAERGLLGNGAVERIGKLANLAADTIAALTAQNAELVGRVQEQAEQLEVLKMCEANLRGYCEDYKGTIDEQRKTLAAALRVDNGTWPTLLSKVAPAGENRQQRHRVMCEALGMPRESSWEVLAARARINAKVAKKHFASEFASVGDSDIASYSPIEVGDVVEWRSGGAPEQTVAIVGDDGRITATSGNTYWAHQLVIVRKAAPAPTERDAIAEWLALSDEEQAAAWRFTKMGPRAFTALVGEVRRGAMVIPPRTAEWAAGVDESYTNAECALAALIRANGVGGAE